MSFFLTRSRTFERESPSEILIWCCIAFFGGVGVLCYEAYRIDHRLPCCPVAGLGGSCAVSFPCMWVAEGTVRWHVGRSCGAVCTSPAPAGDGHDARLPAQGFRDTRPRPGAPRPPVTPHLVRLRGCVGPELRPCPLPKSGLSLMDSFVPFLGCFLLQ